MAVSGTLLRVGVTLVAVAAAFMIGWQLWSYYTLSPWTRDARVLANVVEIAPDVSGLVTAVNVVDNQLVKKGDVLFVIDQDRFKAALQQAKALVDMNMRALRLAYDNAARDARLAQDDSSAISVQAVEKSAIAAGEAQANLDEAQAELVTAQINLTRSKVLAPVDGYVTNLNVFVGNYATVGQGVMALVDSNSFYVYAYFMETKLPAIREGDAVRIELMAGGVMLDGVVEGLSRAIANPTASGGLLASVNPEFDWIRLAQRIPVRIKLGALPSGVRLAAGMSATVVVLPERR